MIQYDMVCDRAGIGRYCKTFYLNFYKYLSDSQLQFYNFDFFVVRKLKKVFFICRCAKIADSTTSITQLLNMLTNVYFICLMTINQNSTFTSSSYTDHGSKITLFITYYISVIFSEKVQNNKITAALKRVLQRILTEAEMLDYALIIPLKNTLKQKPD